MKCSWKKSLAMMTIALAPALAAAQQKLPPPQDDNDPVPPAPSVSQPREGVTEQAGIGGTQAFARAGVMELGGSASFASATDLVEFELAPTIGYFFMDNWQISGIFSWSYANVADESNHIVMLLAEPSFHVPFTEIAFGFAGVGVGLSHQSASDADIGFALAPRVGLKWLVGRSGMLTTDLRMTFATNDLIQTSRGTLLTVDSALGLGVGYTVLW
jgi:hypothetical protein